jgi:hypothetical protein
MPTPGALNDRLSGPQERSAYSLKTHTHSSLEDQKSQGRSQGKDLPTSRVRPHNSQSAACRMAGPLPKPCAV